MICLHCDNETFERTTGDIIQCYRGGKLMIKNAAVMKCIQCGWITIGADQIDELLNRVKEKQKTC